MFCVKQVRGQVPFIGRAPQNCHKCQKHMKIMVFRHFRVMVGQPYQLRAATPFLGGHMHYFWFNFQKIVLLTKISFFFKSVCSQNLS